MAKSRTTLLTAIVIIVIIAVALIAYVSIGNNTAQTTTVTQGNTIVMTLLSSNTVVINASQGGSVITPGVEGVPIKVVIRPGTFAQVGNQILPVYNFTLATFTMTNNVPSPPNAPNSTPMYSFAFEINGMLDPTVGLVNSTGSAMPATTIARYHSSWGSWTWLNGTFDGAAGTYTGGTWRFLNSWSGNNTAGTITNTKFSKAVMWVFVLNSGQGNSTA
ncbi:MAG: hypothetical protein KGH59_03330 [Candidatus Micrarchaeota archaeon]|nr:hypothetical protein [Candidatus Micrarchaeota archaeon]MDE1804788.1 hypothetical protein [Candidatus Micrarchaeota archaeon]